MIEIFDKLNAAYGDRTLADSDQIKDKKFGKKQDVLNKEILDPDDPNSLKSKVDSFNGIVIDPDNVVSTDKSDIEVGSSKIPTGNAVAGALNDAVLKAGVFDISAYNLTNDQPTPYADLEAALGNNGENVPEAVRKGGMQVKFIQGSVGGSDNKYIQARCMAQNFTTDTTQWQGVDDEPTAGSDNLIKSKAVEFLKESIFGNTSISLGVLGPDIAKTWNNVTEGFSHIVIPVLPGDTVEISGVGSTFGFLKNYPDVVEQGTPINYSEQSGFTGRLSVNGTETYTVPSDSDILVVMVENNGARNLISVSVNGYNMVKGILDDTQLNQIATNNLLRGFLTGIKTLPLMPFTLGSDNKWFQPNASHCIFKIKEGDVIRAEIGNGSLMMGFLRSYYIPTNINDYIDYSKQEGYTQRIPSTGTYVCPSDAKYLIVRVKDNNGNYQIPDVLKINGVDIIKGSIERLASSIASVSSDALTSINIFYGLINAYQYPCTLGPSGYWAQSDIATHVVYKVKPGDAVKVDGSSFALGFLKSYTIPSDGLQIDYSSETGYTGRITDAPGNYTCPSDANYLIVKASVNGIYNQIPQILTINGVDCLSGFASKGGSFPSARLIQITDPHCYDSDIVQDGVNNEQRMTLMLNMMLDEAKKGKIDAVISTGDNSIAIINTGVRDNNHILFKHLVVDELEKEGIPFIPVVGNHDAYTDEEWYAAYGKQKQYSVDLGSVYVIVLNVYHNSLEWSVKGTSYPGADDKGYILASTLIEEHKSGSKDYRFTTVDTVFLERQLQIAQSLGKKPIVCCHTFDYASVVTADESAAATSVTEANRLLIQYGCKLIMFGHSHILGNGTRSNGWQTNPGWFGPLLNYEYTQTINSAWGINVFEENNGNMMCYFNRLAHNYVDSIGNVEGAVIPMQMWGGELGRATYKY